jgi:hypothetical protein
MITRIESDFVSVSDQTRRQLEILEVFQIMRGGITFELYKILRGR